MHQTERFSASNMFVASVIYAVYENNDERIYSGLKKNKIWNGEKEEKEYSATGTEYKIR